jgi:hypothetical protein
MAMQYDVKAGSAAANTSTTVFSGRTRVKGLLISYAGAGTVTIKDGGASGTTRFSFTAPADSGCVNVLVPGEGILCDTDIYVTNSANTTAVVFYG